MVLKLMCIGLAMFWISYFPAAVIQHHDKATYGKRGSSVALVLPPWSLKEEGLVTKGDRVGGTPF